MLANYPISCKSFLSRKPFAWATHVAGTMVESDLMSKRRTRQDYGYIYPRLQNLLVRCTILPQLVRVNRCRPENDVYHNLNNGVYSFLIESIFNSYLIERCGLDPAKSQQVGLVVSTYCDYFGQVKYPQILDLGFRVVKLGKSSVMYEVGFFEQGHKEVRAVGGHLRLCRLRLETTSERWNTSKGEG